MFYHYHYFFSRLSTFQRYVCEQTSQNNEQQRTRLDSGIMVANNGSTLINGNIHSGQLITLNIHVPRDNINEPMQFDVQMSIGDVCRSIQGHLPITIERDRKRERENKRILVY